MPAKFVLISCPQNTPWPSFVRQALAPLGMVEIIPESDVVERVGQYRCHAVIIIDALTVEDVSGLLSRLRDRCPECPVVVATSSPTWQRARDAFLAGAVDYIRRSWDSKELLNTIKEILKQLGPADFQNTGPMEEV